MKRILLEVLCCSAMLTSQAMAQMGGRFTQTNLVSDVPGLAAHTDPGLVNAWGLASSQTGPWWVNAAETSLSLVYDGDGNPFPAASPLRVVIPPAGESEPTGIVFNETEGFALAAGQRALFLFASASGTISGWNPNVNAASAVIRVTKTGAAYTGLTLGRISGRSVLYAANFAGSVDVFDSEFNPVTLGAGAFQDPRLPAGYGPFNVQNIGGSIYVMFAKRGADGDEEAGAGFGYVASFTPEGALIQRLEHGEWMNAPWGIAFAPPGFGAVSRRLLVGQFGSGQIATFNPENGKFMGLMRGNNKEPIEIEGLWGIRFGNGGNAGSERELFFAAGPEDEEHGLFGKLTPSRGESDDDEGDERDDRR